jgi:hypothetical protein
MACAAQEEELRAQKAESRMEGKDEAIKEVSGINVLHEQIKPLQEEDAQQSTSSLPEVVSVTVHLAFNLVGVRHIAGAAGADV